MSDSTDRPGIPDADDLTAIVSKLHEQRRGYVLTYMPGERPEWPYAAMVLAMDAVGRLHRALGVWRLDVEGTRR